MVNIESNKINVLKKIIILIALIILLNIFSQIFTLNVYADDSSIKLINWDIEAYVKKDGSVNITEVWDVKYSGITTLFRNFDEPLEAIIDPKVSKIDGDNIIPFEQKEYAEKRRPGEYHKGVYEGKSEIGWGVSGPNQSGREKFKIEYTLNTLTKRYEDISELYYKVIAKDNATTTENLRVKVTFEAGAVNVENAKIFGHRN